MFTLLMTGTITPSLKIRKWYKGSIDPELRYQEYCNALNFYIKNSNFDNIVFCENSMFPSKNFYHLIDECKLRGKKFEYLTFMGDVDKTIEKTHAYGDMECIDYAVNHSKIIKNSESFYKITGRYVYLNINDVLTFSQSCRNYFFRRLDVFAFFEVNTAFFKVNKSDYLKYFYNLKSNIKGEIMEQLYFKIIKNNNIFLGKVKVVPNKKDGNFGFFNGLLFLLGFGNIKGFPGCIIEYIGKNFPSLRFYIGKMISGFRR